MNRGRIAAQHIRGHKGQRMSRRTVAVSGGNFISQRAREEREREGMRDPRGGESNRVPANGLSLTLSTLNPRDERVTIPTVVRETGEFSHS